MATQSSTHRCGSTQKTLLCWPEIFRHISKYFGPTPGTIQDDNGAPVTLYTLPHTLHPAPYSQMELVLMRSNFDKRPHPRPQAQNPNTTEHSMLTKH